MMINEKKVKNLILRSLVSCIIVGFCMLFITTGPKMEMLNIYTGLTFMAGLITGILVGMTAMMWIMTDEYYRKFKEQ